ncbi:MAG: hypothetical protein ABIQ13_03900 [Pedococcus sp.]
MSSPRPSRSEVRAQAHAGAISRAELRAMGWDRDAVAREVRAERWAVRGRQTVAVHTGPLDREAIWWSAIWEVGHDIAALDGVTALQAAGLTGFDDDRVHVSVVHTARVRPPRGTSLHKVVRRVDGELAVGDLARTVPAVASVRAAHWATSSRQAALLLVMPVQQRLVTGRQLLEAVQLAPGRNRRAFIRTVAADIADGAQSLGELDFAALCRARGLPAPTRQAVRRGHRGRVYLDVRWDHLGLVVEIDGAQHAWGLASTDDQFRQNSLVLSGDRVLRMTLLGLRLQPQEFMDQVCAAHDLLSRRRAS